MAESSREQQLWSITLRCFLWNRRGSDDEQASLNRIAYKCILKREPNDDDLPGPSFNSSNCAIRKTVLTLRDLANLELYHGETEGRKPATAKPFVVLIYNGRHLLIDGNHRVNKWLSENKERHCPTIIIEPRESAVDSEGCDVALGG